jgi:steroid delta-isomerase-like uncharacterized protein
MVTDIQQSVETLNASWSSHDVERLLKHFSPDFEGEDVGVPHAIRGHEGVRAWVGPYWEAFPDLVFDLHEIIAQGERVVLVWDARATHQGPLMGIPATGKSVVFKGTSVLTMRDGIVHRGSYVWDTAALLRAIGVLPS